MRSDGGRGEPSWYQVPLGAASERPDELPDVAHVGSLRTDRGDAHLFDALADEELALEFCSTTPRMSSMSPRVTGCR